MGQRFSGDKGDTSQSAPGPVRPGVWVGKVLWEVNRSGEAQPITRPSGLRRKVLRGFTGSSRSVGWGLGLWVSSWFRRVPLPCWGWERLGCGRENPGREAASDIPGVCRHPRGFADILGVCRLGSMGGSAAICCRPIISGLQSAPGVQERWDPQVFQPRVEASRFKGSARFLRAP